MPEAGLHKKVVVMVDMNKDIDIPDQEMFDRLKREYLALSSEKRSLQSRYEQIMQKTLTLKEIRQPIMEKTIQQVSAQVINLFIFQKDMERQKQEILHKEAVYQENVMKVRDKIMALLQSIDPLE